MYKDKKGIQNTVAGLLLFLILKRRATGRKYDKKLCKNDGCAFKSI
jgi:hypothetical protein